MRVGRKSERPTLRRRRRHENFPAEPYYPDMTHSGRWSGRLQRLWIVLSIPWTAALALTSDWNSNFGGSLFITALPWILLSVAPPIARWIHSGGK